jgi:hypothetical protein
MDTQQESSLRNIADRLTPAELSVLHAALAEESTQQPVMLTTSPGSNNDRLWSEMAALGWMSVGEPLEIPVPSRVFRINPGCKEQISAFLASHAHACRITAVTNELRGKIAPMLIDAVHKADGTPFDLALMLATIVEGTMRRSIKPGLHDEFLREVAKLSEALRSV